MKRFRDDIETDQENKKYRQDQFSAYIQHRNRDNSAAVIETNPNRFLNAIFELAFHLHLSKDSRENSWRCMEVTRDVQVVDVKQLFLRASACIWMVQKQTGHSSAFRISTFLTTLPKVTMITYIYLTRERGHDLYQPSVMGPLFEEFKNTIDIVSQTMPQPEAVKRLEESYHLYQANAVLYDIYQKLFKILVKFDRVDYSNTHMAPGATNPIVDIFRFGWAILLYASHILMPDEVEKKSITLWTVLFIATQIPESLLRTCEQVNQLLSQQCQYQLIVPESMAFQTWKTQITQMNDLMSLWIHVQDRHQLVLDKFKDYLEKLKSRGFLISEEDTVCHYPWRIYKNAFEDGQGGLLQMNMQSLVYEIDKESKKLGLEIDLIAFAPTWDRAIATPRRFLRTPGKSIVSRSCTRNVLKNSCHSSSMNKSFLATPFSAVGMVGSRVPFAEKSTHQMLVELFPNRITNRDHLPEMIQNRFNNAVEKIVSKTGSKTKEIWDLSESIYYDLMIRLYSKLENQSQEFQNEVLHDGQFHRTIFCLAFEIVRFAKDYQSIGFQFLFQSCIANAPELYIMIKMLLEECIKTPQWPREVVKRLVGIQERILESDIWTDPSFYSFLTFANSSIENLPAMVADSYVMKLFSILCPKSVSTISYYPKQFMKEKPGKFSAFLYIYDSIMKLAKNRLERFFIEDSLAMTTQSQEEARKYMMMCIKNEHMLKLISGRHLDSIIIMSLYLGTRFDTANQKIRMIDIVTIYKTHPHFVQNAFYSIFVGPNQTTTITDFYDNVYLPKLRTVAPELQQSQTNPLSLSNIVNSNKLVLGTNESPFKIPKTPQTSQKLKKRLFASPRPPIGGSPLAKPPLAPNV